MHAYILSGNQVIMQTVRYCPSIWNTLSFKAILSLPEVPFDGMECHMDL